MSFILAGLIFVATLAFCALEIMACMMSDAPSEQPPLVATFCTGTVLALLVAASHWLPHIGW